MKRIRNVILGLFAFLLLIGCFAVDYFTANPIKESENELEVWFLLETIKPNIKINFSLISNNPITDFELKNWIFQIGSNIIEFDANNINFYGTEIKTGYFITLFENRKYDYERINNWNQEYQDGYEKISNVFQYRFWMTRYVDKLLADEIRENNISYLKVNLEYSFVINNEIYYHTIDEDFTIKVGKRHYFIFDPRIY